MNDKSDSEFATFIGTIRPIKNDRVNLINERIKNTKKPSTPTVHEQAVTLNSETPDPGDAPEEYFNCGLQRKLQANISQTLIPHVTIRLKP